jgi:signal transduction histidine kinase
MQRTAVYLIATRFGHSSCGSAASIRFHIESGADVGVCPHACLRPLFFVSVCDTGPGIPAAMRPTLLTPDRVVAGSERAAKARASA